jgi:hypothetical protein
VNAQNVAKAIEKRERRVILNIKKILVFLFFKPENE